MNISTSNINFKAEYLDKAVIQKRSFVYKPYEVSIVKFDRDNSLDKKALKSFIKSCGEHSAIEGILYNNSLDEHIVGITTQKDNFHKVNPDEILGVMKYLDFDDGEYYITNLQTKPDYKHSIFKLFRKYKDVGKSLVKMLMDKKDAKRISLFPLDSAIPFYKKLGFIYDEPDMEWKSPDYCE